MYELEDDKNWQGPDIHEQQDYYVRHAQALDIQCGHSGSTSRAANSVSDVLVRSGPGQRLAPPEKPPGGLRRLAACSLTRSLAAAVRVQPPEALPELALDYLHSLPYDLWPLLHEEMAKSGPEFWNAKHGRHNELLFYWWKLQFEPKRANFVIWLAEFATPAHWSQLAFEHILQLPEQVKVHSEELVMTSKKVDFIDSRRQYDFESSPDWRRKLASFIGRFSGLRRLTLGGFADEDCLDTVGKHCQQLERLVLLADVDAFPFGICNDSLADFIERQRSNDNLRELDLRRCAGYSDISCDTLFLLRLLPSLRWLGIRADHFRDAHNQCELSINQGLLPHIHIRLSVDLECFESEWTKQTFLHLHRIFPNADTLELKLDRNAFNAYLRLNIDHHENGHEDFFRRRTVQLELTEGICLRNILSSFPLVERLKVANFGRFDDGCGDDSALVGSPSSEVRINVKSLHCHKKLFNVSPDKMLDFLKLIGPNLQELKVKGEMDITKDQVQELQTTLAECKQLQVLSLRSEHPWSNVALDKHFIEFLRDHCHSLKRVEGIASWSMVPLLP